MDASKWYYEKTEESETERQYSAWKTVYSKIGGHVENQVYFDFIEIGHGDEPLVCVKTDDMWVYLSPEQLLYFVKLLGAEEKDFVELMREYVKGKGK